MLDEHGSIFLGGEENILNYPSEVFQVWFIRTVGSCWDYIVSYATITGAVLCFG